MNSYLILLILLSFFQQTLANSKVYQVSDPIDVFVDNVSPFDNPSETYRYYILNFCQPETVYEESQTLGENLSGDRKMNSVYSVYYKRNQTNTSICTQKFDEFDIERFKYVIKDKYIAEFFIENIDTHDVLGYAGPAEPQEDEDQTFYLKNHIGFQIYLNSNNEILHANISSPESFDFVRLEDGEHPEQLITFYYSVYFYTVDELNISEIDQIDDQKDELEIEEIHSFAIIISFFLVILLVIFSYLLLSRIIRRDVHTSQQFETDGSDEIGWKLIRTEVFLPPSNKLLLCSFIGNGIQFLILSLLLSFLGFVGFYHSSKGNHKTIGILAYAFTGFFNGFYSSKYYKYLGGKHWALNVLVSCLLFPFLLFIVWSVPNAIAWSKDSTAVVPISSFIFVLVLCILIYVPLTVMGGITAKVMEDEVLPNIDTQFLRICKPIPDKSCVQGMFFQCTIAGGLPFISICIQMYYMFMSVWGHRIYHLYGTLLLAVILLIIVIILITVAFTYFNLKYQDYNWQWKSFFYGGYISTIYYIKFNKHFCAPFLNLFFLLKIIDAWLPIIIILLWVYDIILLGNIYGNHPTLTPTLYYLKTLGSMGFLSSLKFIRYIYKQSKIE